MKTSRRIAVCAAGVHVLRPALVLMWVLSLLATCALPLRAEWQNFGMGEGLASNYAVAVTEDSSGNLWFGTGRGVSRFDGVSWTTYTSEDGLADNCVYAIGEDSTGKLWFGTRCGVSRFDGVSWMTYTPDDGLAGYGVLAIIGDSSGDLWFGTSGGVSRYDGASWTTYTTDDGLAHNYVLAIVEDGSGDLWFGTRGGGVSRYDGVSWTTYTADDGLADNDVHAIVEDSSGDLWCGTRYGGVRRLDGVGWTTYTTEDGLADDYMYAIVEDSSGDLWFGTRYGGVSRFDGVSWTTYTSEDDGLADNEVYAIIEDSSGNLWFGTFDGVSCYDGVSWTTYTMDDGLACEEVHAIIEDSSGDLWFGTRGGGVSRYDGVIWTTYTTGDGLVGDHVLAIIEDGSGNLWFGTEGDGVSRFDGVDWTTYTTGDGLAGDHVLAIIEDCSGNLWFGTRDGVSRYDGVGWTTYTADDGLGGNRVRAIIKDSSDNLWFATDGGGVSRYDGVVWTTYATGNGLVDNRVLAIAEDGSGSLWFGTEGGVSAHEPDRVAPQTVIWPTPPLLIPSRVQHIAFRAAYGESWYLRFSHALDGFSWSEWTPMGSWVGNDLSDGEHVFEVRATDAVGNVDSTPAVVTFEVDATPPAAVIASPVFGEAVRGSVAILGTAADPRFLNYAIEVRHVGSAVWDALVSSSSPVAEGLLGGWNTTLVSDGDYELRLSVMDTLDLTGTGQVRVDVDNEAPWAWETSPVAVSASTGGDVYTTNREVHLYFPPHAFAGDVTVSVIPADEGSVPDSLPGGADLVLAGYSISWEGTELEKPATLQVTSDEDGAERDRGEVLALYVLAEGDDWERLGGTVSSDECSISAPITCEGTYALFSDLGTGTGAGLSAVSFTPRVFSPSRSFANDEVAVSFTLGRAGFVTARVYNRAGRLVTLLASDERMNAGANLLRWDGQDSGGSTVPDGLYVVTVEALGETQTSTLAVVR